MAKRKTQETQCPWCGGPEHTLCGALMAANALNGMRTHTSDGTRAHCYWCKQPVEHRTECQGCLELREELFRLTDEAKASVLEAIQAARTLHADFLLVRALSAAANVLRLVLEQVSHPPRGGPELRDYDGAHLESDLAVLMDVEKRRAERRKTWWTSK